MGGVARIAHVLVPALPHDVTQPNNRRQQTLLVDEDVAE